MVRWTKLSTTKAMARAVLVLAFAVFGIAAIAAVAARPPGYHLSDRDLRYDTAGRRDVALQPPAPPGADSHLAQYCHRDAVDRGPGADPGTHRDPVLQTDVLHGQGAKSRDDDQSDRAPVVLVLRISRPRWACL